MSRGFGWVWGWFGLGWLGVGLRLCMRGFRVSSTQVWTDSGLVEAWIAWVVGVSEVWVEGMVGGWGRGGGRGLGWVGTRDTVICIHIHIYIYKEIYIYIYIHIYTYIHIHMYV